MVYAYIEYDIYRNRTGNIQTYNRFYRKIHLLHKKKYLIKKQEKVKQVVGMHHGAHMVMK